VKTRLFWMMSLLAIAAHAEVIAPKGQKATLRVEYVYTSAGKYVTSSKDQKRDWNAKRTVTLTANYLAEAAQAMGALHKDDPKQQQQMAAMQSRVATTAKKMEPTMADMMAINEKCEREAALPNDRQDEAKFEACIGQAIMTYKMTDQQQAAANEARQVANGISAQMSAQRFQLWKLVSQDGQYAIDETYNRQVYEMTCTDVKVCKSSETRKGGGRIPSPAGKPGVGVSLLEVDAEKKDIVMMLPMPLAPLTFTRTLTTSIPDEKNATSNSDVMPIQWMMKAQQITVSIPADLRTVTGSKSYPIEGENEEKGALTVNWTFTRL
jgi:hypothetical protein